jgi:hypothetical protein
MSSKNYSGLWNKKPAKKQEATPKKLIDKNHAQYEPSNTNNAVVKEVPDIPPKRVIDVDLSNTKDQPVYDDRTNATIQSPHLGHKESSPPGKKMDKTFTVNIKFLNVRSEPSKKGAKIHVLTHGEKVTVISFSEDWCTIASPRNNKEAAYVMTKYIS